MGGQGDADAFTLQIHRYSQALIDLASVDSLLIRYCVAGEVCMDKQLCGVCSNGWEQWRWRPNTSHSWPIYLHPFWQSLGPNSITATAIFRLKKKRWEWRANLCSSYDVKKACIYSIQKVIYSCVSWTLLLHIFGKQKQHIWGHIKNIEQRLMNSLCHFWWCISVHKWKKFQLSLCVHCGGTIIIYFSCAPSVFTLGLQV